ncbi:MAG: SRPBCC family protein [Betaproteobacteria bacterium]
MTSSLAASTDRIEREIQLKATRSRVWQALSNAEEFGIWFGAALKGQKFVVGQRVQGQITIRGFEHVLFDALVVELKPEQLFSYCWHPYAIDPAIDYSTEETTLVTMELSDIAGGTLLKVIESGFDKLPAVRRDEAFRMNSGGWEGQLRNIARHVDSA